MFKRAFTLIELLVVIAIISVLASVVITAVENLRNDSKQAVGKRFSGTLQRSLGDTFVGAWSFDSDNLLDSSGYGPHLGWVGTGGYVDGVDGGRAIELDQFGEYATGTLSMAVGANDQITMEAWVDVQDGYSADAAVIGMDQTVMLVNSVNLRLAWHSSAGSGRYITATYDNIDDGWHHIAMTYDYATDIGQIYVDGVLIHEEEEGNVNDSFTRSSLAIGARRASGSWEYFGKIDNPRIYSQAITAGEIYNHYVQERDKYQGLATR